MDCGCHSHNGFQLRPSDEGLAQRDAIRLASLVVAETFPYLDKVGSVSALVEVEENFVWDDQLIDEQHRRAFNGS